MDSNRPDDFPFPVPIVSAIVERKRGKTTELLMQVRWKPKNDPVYSGTFEIPAGSIELGESVYDALKREVFEETGLRVTGFRPDVRTKTHSQRGDEVFAFVPFCCQQQITGRARVGFVFICSVEDAAPFAATDEVRDIKWMTTSAVRKLIEESPERMFTFQLPVLEFYLSQLKSA
jgi:8-oxo-dGTP pyrophosphatase MutT (NUDIX family)